MTDQTSPPLPVAHPVPKPLPDWVWLLAAALFPVGTFLALAAACLLRWSVAVLASILACLPLVPIFAVFDHFSQRRDVRASLIQSVAIFVMVAYLLLVGWYQYHLGARFNYWSPKARRVWLVSAVIAIALLFLILLSLSLLVLLASFLNAADTL